MMEKDKKEDGGRNYGMSSGKSALNSMRRRHGTAWLMDWVGKIKASSFQGMVEDSQFPIPFKLP